MTEVNMQTVIEKQMQCCGSFDFREAFGARSDDELSQIAAVLDAMTPAEKRAMNERIKAIAREQRRHHAAPAN